MATANQIKLNWYQALTVSERMAIPREADLALPFDAERAERRLRRWKQQPPFDTGRYFEERLASDGITEADLLTLLGESSDGVPARETFEVPTWMAALTEAYERAAESEALDLSALRGEQEKADLVDFAEPLIRQGLDRLRQKVADLNQEYKALPFAESALASLFVPNLLPKLSIIAGRTLVLELNVARLQGTLRGETPEERYANYIEHLRRPEVALAIFEEYPVLARQLSIAVDQWVEVSFEFLARLVADWGQIRATFCPGDEPGRLVEAAGGAGDSHKGGRSVMLLKFESGFRLAYKPRSLAVDVHFQELLEWLNARGDHPPFRTLSVLDRESYGWVEFVAAAECKDAEELRRFYERQGGYLALLYAMGGVDFHNENLVAAGDHPVLLDVEALFHPRIYEVNTSGATVLAEERLSGSVLGCGLLPYKAWGNDQSEGVDISGLGGAGGQLTPFQIPQWESFGTDTMHIVRKRTWMPAQLNRPMLDGHGVDVADWIEPIALGFDKIYRLLMKHREELLAANGPVTRFAQDEVRVILRRTSTYIILLRESFHPMVLRDAFERDRLLDRLWAPVPEQGHLQSVVAAEQEDLHEGNVPIFSTKPGSKGLLSSKGRLIPNLIVESGLEIVQKRIRTLSEQDLSFQLWVTRASIASSAVEMPIHAAPPLVLSKPYVGREQLIDAACAVGNHLATRAIRGDRDATWIGLTADKTGNACFLSPMGVELYDGLSGVALFLGYLGSHTGEDHYTVLSRQVLSGIRQSLESQTRGIEMVGAFAGLGGLIYSLSHLGQIWNDPALIAEAEDLVPILAGFIARDQSYDIVAGSAGAIGSLLSLHRVSGSKQALTAAVHCGDHLLKNAISISGGIGWITPNDSRALSGFSHGAAGFFWSLLELSTVSGQSRFRQAAIEALTYERSLFSDRHENWLDLRDFQFTPQTPQQRKPDVMVAWCHGAPGIGLSRIRAMPVLMDGEMRSEIDVAIKTTLQHGFGGNHSLCHGDLGNLDFLLLASEVLSDDSLRGRVYRQAAATLTTIERRGWQCATPVGVETPGLMTGLAGIGYGLLRLALPDRVPSVLALEPPRSGLFSRGLHAGSGNSRSSDTV